MFGTILTLLVTLMQCYVFWRAASVDAVRRHVSAKRLLGGGLALWALFVLCRYLSPARLGSLAEPAELWSMTWLGALFLLSVTLLMVDIGTGFGWLFKPYRSRLRGIALIAGGVLSVLAMVQGERAPVVQSYHVYAPSLPKNLDGTVIVALSDWHLGTVIGEKWLAARVEQVQAQQPDAVVLLGDIVEGHGTVSAEVTAALRRLSAPLGVWGVTGNHESYGADEIRAALLDQAGIHVLHNAWVELRPGLTLAGVDNLSASQSAELSFNLALDHRPVGATVLMSHVPLFAQLAASQGVDLMLSGHTHGGQIWPFGYLVMQQFPLFAGEYAVGAMTVIVSRGTGTWGPRMRLWHRAEIVRVTLHCGNH